MFPAPPDVVVLPETEVYVVPSVPEEIFFFNGWWCRPWHGHWYRSLRYDAGWGVYGGVPVWYRGIPRGWREDYRNHIWAGHPWNYRAIHYGDLQRNWRTWHNADYWNRPENRQFTHTHDGRLYEGGQAKLETGTQGKYGTGEQGSLNKGAATEKAALHKGTTTAQKRWEQVGMVLRVVKSIAQVKPLKATILQQKKEKRNEA